MHMHMHMHASITSVGKTKKGIRPIHGPFCLNLKFTFLSPAGGLLMGESGLHIIVALFNI